MTCEKHISIDIFYWNFVSRKNYYFWPHCTWRTETHLKVLYIFINYVYNIYVKSYLVTIARYTSYDFNRDSNYLFTFFHMHKKKVLDLRKFSTSGFRWIYMFWNVLNTIWPFLENVCLCVCLQNFVDTVSQEQMHGKSWNFLFSCTLITTGTDLKLANIAQ